MIWCIMLIQIRISLLSKMNMLVLRLLLKLLGMVMRLMGEHHLRHTLHRWASPML